MKASNNRRFIPRYEAQNLESAEIILADVQRYGGEESGAVQWARLFMARTEGGRRGQA